MSNEPLPPLWPTGQAPGATDWVEDPGAGRAQSVPGGRAGGPGRRLPLDPQPDEHLLIALDAGDIDTYADLFAPDARSTGSAASSAGARRSTATSPASAPADKKLPKDATEPAAVHPRLGQPADRLHRSRHGA